MTRRGNLLAALFAFSFVWLLWRVLFVYHAQLNPLINIHFWGLTLLNEDGGFAKSVWGGVGDGWKVNLDGVLVNDKQRKDFHTPPKY